MNLTPEKLSQNIIALIWHELLHLLALGKIELDMNRNEQAKQMKQWEIEVCKIIKDADNQRKFLAYFDGSAKPNPGIMSIGGYIQTPEGKQLYAYSINLGEGTNNVAEYQSLIHVLRECGRRGIQRVLIRGDSQLTINQVMGIWKAKDPIMKQLCDEAVEAMSKIPDCKLMWHGRNQNKKADKLADQGHDLSNQSHGIP
jgi:ribonuclease HI